MLTRLFISFILINTMAFALEYPEAPRVLHTDDYHGVTVADPYRWLENLESEQTKKWVKEQEELARDYLDDLPMRDYFKDRITEMIDFERQSAPYHEGGYYFYRKNSGLQNQSVYYRKKGLKGVEELVIDPNTLSEDGTVSIAGTSVGPAGQMMAYALSNAGSDWRTIRIRNLETGKDLEDVVEWVKFSGISWTGDGKGVFYARFPKPSEAAEKSKETFSDLSDQKVYYHRIGTPQNEDQLILEMPDQPEWGLHPFVTEDKRYLGIHISHGTDPRNRLYFKDLGDPENPSLGGDWIKLIDDFTHEYSPVGNLGSVFYVMTDKDAPRKRVLSVDIAQQPFKWKEVIPQQEGVLESVGIVGGKLVVSEMRDAHSLFSIYDVHGNKVKDIELPDLGAIGSFTGDMDRPELFYSFTSFLYPTSIFRYDLESHETETFFVPEIEFDPAPFVSEQLFFESKDDTRVPMFIVRRKDMPKDGNNPVYMTAYGGFGVSYTPGFFASVFAWIEKGGVFVLPNIRGGGEYGKEWHDAGIGANKQNSYDDVIAAAEFLIEKDYTRAGKIAIGGGSNGGLMVGAVLNQRPDLWGAAIPRVGVMDLLRFQHFTIGWAWVPEYGSSEKLEDFPRLYSLSPYHNIRNIAYPPTLVTTADHDDRVHPAHSFKYTAMLQSAQLADTPVVLRVERKAGHGGGTPLNKVIEQQADSWAFIAEHLLKD